MPSKTTTRLVRCAGAVALALGALVGPLATPSGAADSIVTASSVLAPPFVTAGRIAFYSARWVNDSNATLTNPEVLITLPAGSALVSADPPVCTVSSPPGPSGPVVSCARDNLASGASLTQQLLVRVPTMSETTDLEITATMTAKEGGSDSNK